MGFGLTNTVTSSLKTKRLGWTILRFNSLTSRCRVDTSPCPLVRKRSSALKGLEDVLQLQRDESVMIFGASGGIGHLAVQLAKRLGARVFAVASGEDGVSFVKRLGADAAVDGRSDNVLDVAREFATDGIDAALVTAGGEAADRALSAIRPDGRVAYPNGVMPEPKAPARVRIDAYDGEGGREALDRLNQLIQAGPFEVEVHRTFPLEDAAAAQAALDEHHLGKIALRVG